MEVLAATGALLVGGVLLVLAWGNIRYERHRRSSGMVTEGRIVASDWHVNSVAAIYQAPEVEFVDHEGRTCRFWQPSGTTFSPDVGGTVQVRYDPGDPDSTATIDRDIPTRIFPIVFGGAGLVAAVVGAVLLLAAVG